MSIVETFCDEIEKMTWENIPKERLCIEKDMIADSFACMLAGSRSRKLLDYVMYARSQNGDPKVSVVGLKGLTVEAGKGAMANAMAGHIRDYDNTFMDIRTIYTSTALGTILAVAQTRNVNGKKALEAFDTGLRVLDLLSSGIDSRTCPDAFDLSAVFGLFSTVAAIGKLYGLNKTEWKNALSMAASNGFGLRANYSFDTKDLTLGYTAEKAVFLVEAAKMGFTANERIFEDDKGFLNAFGTTFHFDRFTQALHEPEEIFERMGLFFKRYPVNGWIGPVVDAALKMKREQDLAFEDILSVRCDTNATAIDEDVSFVPKNGNEAKFSLRYCLATALKKDGLSLRDFDDASVADNLRHMKKVETGRLEKYAERCSRGIRFTVRLKNGTVLHRDTPVADRFGVTLLSETEKQAKIRECVGGMVGRGKLMNLLGDIREFEKIISVGGFVREINEAAM